MTRPRRTLRFAMWACVALAICAIGLWIAGVWYTLGARLYRHRDVLAVHSGNGSLKIVWIADASLPSKSGARLKWTVDESDGGWRGEWDWYITLGEGNVVMPSWFPPLLLLVASAACHRLSRRSIPGLCQRCHYDLSGVPAGTCPECGHVAGG